jgi:hypothetical protein
LKNAFSILAVVGIARLMQELSASWSSPIEPDTPAIFLQVISLGILGWGLSSVWKKANKKEDAH